MHWLDARADGEEEARLYGLDAWRESPLYDERERAALALCEAVTHIDRAGVPDDVWAEAQAHFEEPELAHTSARSPRPPPGTGCRSPRAPCPARHAGRPRSGRRGGRGDDERRGGGRGSRGHRRRSGPMTIAVVGGTGTLGSLVVADLLARGERVAVLTRTGAGVPAGAEHRRVDLTSGEGLDLALDGVSAVVDAANSQKGVKETLVEGTRRLAEAGARAGSPTT